MKKNSIAQFVGVITSFVIIWLINDYLLVDKCLEMNGVFNYHSGECLLPSGEIHANKITEYLMAFYFFGAILVALSISHIIRKIFKIER